jgi:hypothetical protein
VSLLYILLGRIEETTAKPLKTGKDERGNHETRRSPCRFQRKTLFQRQARILSFSPVERMRQEAASENPEVTDDAPLMKVA